jgi:hypothetical protein
VGPDRGKHPEWVLDLDRSKVSVRGETPEALAARKAANEAEAEAATATLNQNFN